MQEEGINITVNSVHPGLIMTPLMRYSELLMGMLLLYVSKYRQNMQRKG